MKVLHLSKKIPYPLKDGESLAIHYLSKGLVENGCSIDLLSLNTQKHHTSIEHKPAELAHFHRISVIDIDTSIRATALIGNLFTKESYNINRFYSLEFAEALQKMLDEEDYDCVILETLYMAAYMTDIRSVSDAFIVMRSHNLEHEIWRNLSDKSKNPLKRIYYTLCSDRLQYFEEIVQQNYDLLVPISSEDEKKYRKLNFKGSSCVIPVGLDLTKYNIQKENNEVLRIGYIGSLDWKPNLEGLDWFFGDVWTELQNNYPQLEFHLAGRNYDGRYAKYSSQGLVIHGEVDDAISFMNSLDVLLVPLFSGSGIRIKILEGMSLGKVVISTVKGFEGIPVIDREDVLFFDDKTSLIKALSDCIENIATFAEMRSKARMVIEQNFSYSLLGKKLVTKLESFLNY